MPEEIEIEARRANDLVDLWVEELLGMATGATRRNRRNRRNRRSENMTL
jgi:hypothetical protein